MQVDQHSHGNRLALSRGDLRAWTAQGADGETYVALVNLSDAPLDADARWQDVGLPGVAVRPTDLWTGLTGALALGLHVNLRPHASVLYRVPTQRSRHADAQKP